MGLFAATVVVAAAWLIGCASGWQRQGGRFVDSGKGLSISAPTSGSWTPVRVEGSTLTLRRGDGATLSWLRECQGRKVSARTASRELLRGITESEILDEGPVSVDGGEAWQVAARVRAEGGAAELRAVTRVGGGCTDDWVFAAPVGGGTEGLLEAWWPSFAGPEVAAGTGAEAR